MEVSAPAIHSFSTAELIARRRPLHRPIGHLLALANDALESASVTSIGALALIWIALVGCIDYWTGPEYTMLIFYLIPVTLGTWFVSREFGTLLAVLSIVASSFADLAGGLPHIRYWNESIGLGCYLVFVALLSRWRGLTRQLDVRVRERTAELQEEIVQRERLQNEITSIAERERRRLGHDLHDTLCQHLTGTALCAQTLREKLGADADEAERIVGLLEQAIDLTRTMARGLLSPDVRSGDLVAALSNLALNTTERTGIECELHHDPDLRLALDAAVSTQLYRIAHEAVTNACKHARASRIIIELDDETGQLALNVYDDGVGFHRDGSSAGVGLRMMEHGAHLIGAELLIKPNQGRGTVVTATLQ